MPIFMKRGKLRKVKIFGPKKLRKVKIFWLDGLLSAERSLFELRFVSPKS